MNKKRGGSKKHISEHKTPPLLLCSFPNTIKRRKTLRLANIMNLIKSIDEHVGCLKKL